MAFRRKNAIEIRQNNLHQLSDVYSKAKCEKAELKLKDGGKGWKKYGKTRIIAASLDKPKAVFIRFCLTCEYRRR